MSSSSFEKQNKGTEPNMYKLTLCYVIVALATYTDIGSLTVSSRTDISGVCALFLWKISLKDYPETMNLKNQVNLSSCTDVTGMLWSQNHVDMGQWEKANNLCFFIYYWRRLKSATSGLSSYHRPHGIFSPSVGSLREEETAQIFSGILKW